MKSFGQFLTEAVKTAASTEAKLKGLKGDGHGGWYDSKGNFVAKTIQGKLHYTGGRSAAEEEPPAAKKAAPAPATPKKKAAPQVAPAPKVPQQQPSSVEDSGEVYGTADLQQQTAEIMGEPTSEGVVIVFGRFNPPTVGHQKLLDAASSEASRSGFDLRIYPSRSVDPKKNPLQPGAKIEYMSKMFSDYSDNIKDDANARTIFDVLLACNNIGYRAVTIVVGQDRLAEFQSLAQKYNGDIYEFEEINVVSAGARDADAEGVEGMSASKMRLAAAEDDFKAFARGIPNIGNMEKKNLFNLLQKQMGISKTEVKAKKSAAKKAEDTAAAKRYTENEKAKKASEKRRIPQDFGYRRDAGWKESYNLWEIAPKLDPFGLRIAYLKEDVFKIGALVENVNTGLTGRITRRGANYVIIQTSENMMFKSWLKDLVEAYDVGTDEYRSYVQKSTPGQSVRKWNADPIIKPITTGSYWDGKKKKKPEDPSSGPGVKYSDTCKPYKVGKG